MGRGRRGPVSSAKPRTRSRSWRSLTTGREPRRWRRDGAQISVEGGAKSSCPGSLTQSVAALERKTIVFKLRLEERREILFHLAEI